MANFNELTISNDAVTCANVLYTQGEQQYGNLIVAEVIAKRMFLVALAMGDGNPLLRW